MRKKSGTIFFIDDSLDDFKVAERAFRKNGLQNALEYFFSGVEAIKRLHAPSQERPCLILLDLNMPVMDGRDVLFSVKLDKSLKDIPVVILTHSKEIAAVKTCYALGANAYVFKSDNADRLAQNIKRLKECWLDDETPRIFDEEPPLSGEGVFSVLEKSVFADPASHNAHHGIYLSAEEIYRKIMGGSSASPPEGSAPLTPREKETLLWAARGKSRWEISVILSVSEDAVKTRLEKIRRKLGAANTTHAIAMALLSGLLLPDEKMSTPKKVQK